MEASAISEEKSIFSTQAVTVLLISLAVVELFSVTGWATGITSVLPLVVQLLSAELLVALSLFSALGLMMKRSVGVYFALVTSVCIIVLSGFSLTTIYEQSDFNVSLAASSFASLVFGVLSIVLVFKSNGTKKDRPLTPNDSAAVSKLKENAIEIRDVTKKYSLGQNVVSAVNGLCLTIKKGEFVAIMGPSGSGKSTLLNLMGALDKPSAGQILIDGVDISGLNDNQLAKLRNEKIGFVFQAYNLIARSTVMHNMELPALVKGYSREKREEKITELLGTVNLPNKLGRKPKTLSGGEQQRVAIARALINDPEIVLADEPTGNVDSKTGQAIMGFLRKLNSEKRTTVVVVTHDPEVAKRADRIIYFRDGAILKEEPTAAGETT